MFLDVNIILSYESSGKSSLHYITQQIMSKTVNALQTASQIPLKEKQQPDYVSYDAPPLDFSFKNIKQLSELKDIQPRQGEKKEAVQEQKVKASKQEKEEEHAEAEEGEARGDKKKNEVIKLLPQNNINSVVSTMVTTSAMKNISLKAKEQLQKKKKKAIHVKLVCSSLMLGYNKLRQLTGLNTVLGSIVDNLQNLQWIDVSHNYLTTLDYSFEHFPQLKTLYIHCNFIVNLAQLQKLKHLSTLKTLNIHGNPFAAVPNFRILAISILPQLKKLDSVLISKKERDNAIFIRSQTKKYPLPNNPAKPPQEKTEQQDKEKE